MADKLNLYHRVRRVIGGVIALLGDALSVLTMTCGIVVVATWLFGNNIGVWQRITASLAMIGLDEKVLPIFGIVVLFIAFRKS